MSKTVILSHCRLDTHPDLIDTRFEEINLHANKINVIHEEYIPPTCKYIDFSENELRDDGIPIEWPNQLETILLHTNMIAMADGIHWPTQLKILDLYNNPLYCVPSPLPDSIEELTLSSTNIKEITNPLPENLKSLYMTRTYLRSTSINLPSGLLNVYMAENFLSNKGLPRSWGASLEILDLANNQLKTVPNGLPNTLKVLILNHNQIETLPLLKIPSSVKQLSINGNKIRNIEYAERENPINLVSLVNNQLTETKTTEWATIILDKYNWNTNYHHTMARRIQKYWKASRIFSRLRTWLKNSKYKQELYAVSLHPDRILKTDNFSHWHFGC